MNIIYSSTAEQHGFGSMPWKWVSRMSKEEREAVKRGEIVIFDCGRFSGGNNRTGTTLRMVLYQRGRYIPRVPTAEIMEAIMAETEQNT